MPPSHLGKQGDALNRDCEAHHQLKKLGALLLKHGQRLVHLLTLLPIQSGAVSSLRQRLYLALHLILQLFSQVCCAQLACTGALHTSMLESQMATQQHAETSSSVE